MYTLSASPPDGRGCITCPVQDILHGAKEHHARLLARRLHGDVRRQLVQRRRQVGLLAQPVALADAPLELQALLREFLQMGGSALGCCNSVNEMRVLDEGSCALSQHAPWCISTTIVCAYCS